MSYILDALQRSSQNELADNPPNQQQATQPSLALPWKIAIGAVLATNLLFLYLWQTGDGNERDSHQIAARYAEPESLPTQDDYPPPPANPNTRKKTLPGIASPRELPPPQAQAQAQAQGLGQSASLDQTGQPVAGTARTFRPTGAPITIADPPTPRTSSTPLSAREIAAQALADTESTAPSTPSSRIGPEREPERLPDFVVPTEAASGEVSQLHELSASAREALYVLTFSFHIYSEDADLRAVVVNGERMSEGSNVVAENGQSFRLLEIFDTGVVMQFDHDGTTETVEIPVIEDWKEA